MDSVRYRVLSAVAGDGRPASSPPAGAAFKPPDSAASVWHKLVCACQGCKDPCCDAPEPAPWEPHTEVPCDCELPRRRCRSKAAASSRRRRATHNSSSLPAQFAPMSQLCAPNTTKQGRAAMLEGGTGIESCLLHGDAMGVGIAVLL